MSLLPLLLLLLLLLCHCHHLICLLCLSSTIQKDKRSRVQNSENSMVILVLEIGLLNLWQ
jgi:hypothetical protein